MKKILLSMAWLGIAFTTPVYAQAEATVTGDPIERILAQRVELNLSGEQVQKLQDIQKQLSEKDRPTVERIEQIRGRPISDPLIMREMPLEEWQRIQENMEELRPLMAQLRQLHWQAVAEARTVLTPEQNTRLAGLIARGHGAGPASAPGTGRGRGAGAASRGAGATLRGARGGLVPGLDAGAWGPYCPFWGTGGQVMGQPMGRGGRGPGGIGGARGWTRR